MPKSPVRIARLHTTIDLGSVMNLSALSLASEPAGFGTWEDVRADSISAPRVEPAGGVGAPSPTSHAGDIEVRR